MKILMVCLGNICRSPMAEGILRDKIKRDNLKMWVDSAGTSGQHIGEAPDRRMQRTAIQKGVDISDLRSRKFKKKDFKKYDLIYVMDNSNFSNIADLASSPEEKAKIKLILNETHPGENAQVPDPYFGGESGFGLVFDLLDKATDKIVENFQ
ncbi:low molecular weight phosphotyrosine protein phosphatase [Putridiphycobacter roseus]|uniref:protein-tyrosine-phosphatase n=1 Tax=Putridiphycobacter roseus TaxID=2219161 RepID=A0A2W1NFG3_9FLAO|nr:low molecular weight protein-tyrosine-phosphatase [Putridiphycobacter roseus]PZE18215.1 low molecular weight phosphotyrosine protein phosphatase [Putridiphycobacter roseus]